MVSGSGTVLVGLLPIAGALRFGWSELNMFLVLLAGTWIAIVRDALKLVFLKPAILRSATIHYDDWHVWVVVEALRNGSGEAPRSHLQARYLPGTGVTIDFLFGGVAMVVMWGGLVEHGIDLVVLFDAPGVRAACLAVLAWETGYTVWEILAARREAEPKREVKVAAGLRGVGLFLLTFLVLALADFGGGEDRLFLWVMLTLAGLIVARGLATMATPLWLGAETRWLESYLESR